MLRSANAGRAKRTGAHDAMRAVQPAKRRLSASRARQRPSLTASAELLSAGSMRGFVQIDSPTDHACEQPSSERLQVLEPVSGRWSWMRVFGCCNLVAVEPLGDDEQAKT